MQIEAAIKRFERRFTNVVEFDPSQDGAAVAPNGERYLTVTQSGPRGELEPSTPCRDAASAVEGWYREAMKLARGKRTLYWRRRPMVQHQRKSWFVYSRMAFER